MQTVTALTLQKKNTDRVNVFLDGEYAFAVSFDTAVSLHKGQELTTDQIDLLRQQGEQDLAYHQALHFLGYRPRSRAEVERRLGEKGHAPADIDAVLARLERQGYVDDAAFARFWVENRNRFRPRSARALGHELRQKGVSSTIIAAAVAAIDEDAAAWNAASSQLDRWRRLDEHEFSQKATAYLSRRGFSYGVARSAATRAWEEIHDLTSETELDMDLDVDAHVEDMDLDADRHADADIE